jgi:RimJ/RimL family protein N-acetyltransferase/aryl carrier-like protein
MTTLAPAAPTDAPVASRRDTHRRELAELLDREPAALSDDARLVDDLGLDSLAMMRLLTWLETRGVLVKTDRAAPASVGELLSWLEKATFPGLSIQVADGKDPRPVGPVDTPTWSRPSGDQLVPVLDGQAFRLTPVEPNDTGFLYALAVQPETGFRWRYRGAPPPPDRFAVDLWKHTLVQYVARRTTDGQPVGHVVAYGADRDMHHVYLGAAFQPRYAGTGLAAQIVAVFVRYLFHTFPLRKIYLEVPGYNWAQVQSGEDQLFRVEGVLRDHYYYAGGYWDHIVCAIYPDQLSADAP